ncbi:hypothetical protein Tco_0143943 [Tanacetum coccineum]
MTAQAFMIPISRTMNSIEQCIVERESHEQELKITLKNLSERQLQIQQCKVQESQSSVTGSGDETSSGIVSDEEIDKQGLEAHYGFMAKIQEVLPAESSSIDTPLEHKVQNNDEKNVFANERQHSEKNSAEWARNYLDETGRALGEATSCRDSCLIALQNKQNEFEKYKAFNDRTIDYEILQQKHDELVKKSLLTKSQLEGYLKENTKVISDLKVKEDKDIDKMIEMDKQLKFLNEIVYTRNQSIQTIHMLAPKCATYNGRLTFANPRYLKKAQSEKPCLYEIPFDTSDPANRFAPDREETMTLDNESRSKLDKDTVKPYDYTRQNSLYEIFKAPSLEYLYQLERAKEVRKTMWRKPFFNDLQCPTCKKCLYSANHDECVLEYLSRLNPHASAQNKDAKSHKTTKKYMPVEKSSASKKPERHIPTGHRFANKKTTIVPEKTMNPRSCLRWKPTGRIFSNVRLRWIPTGKLLNSCTGNVDSEPAHGSIVDIPHIHACKQTLSLSAGTLFNGQKQKRIDLNADALYNEKQENLRAWLLKLLISKKPVPECSGLVLHQMTSDHNRSELGIQDHSNEQSSLKLVLKVVP